MNAHRVVCVSKMICLLVALGWMLASAKQAVAQYADAGSPQNGAFSFSLNDPSLYAPQDEGADESGGAEPAAEDEPVEGEFRDDSGNDPRDFRNKFMPYFRYTELRNGAEFYDWTIFGFYAFTPRIGMTYELPAFRYVDASGAVPKGFRLINPFSPPGPIGGPGIPGFPIRVSPDVDPYEFGKIIEMSSGPIDSVALYAKPGWGWNKDSFGGDREFTMEVGVRHGKESRRFHRRNGGRETASHNSTQQ